MKKINYFIVPMKSPLDRELPAKYYARIMKRENISLEELLTQITAGSTVNEDEAYTMFKRFLKLIARHVRWGRNVQLDELGSFYMTISSEGHENPEEVSANSIKNKYIRFRPGKLLKKGLNDVQFEKTIDG